MWKFNSNFKTKYIFCFKVCCVVKKLIQNMTFFKIFDSKDVFFLQKQRNRNKLRNKVPKKVRKHVFRHFKCVNWPKNNKIFERELSKQFWFFKMSFTWTAVALLNIMVKIWRVVKRMFQNLTLFRNSDSKNDELCRFD